MKHCRFCKRDLPFDRFSPKRGGYSSKCKDCVNLYNAIYYQRPAVRARVLEKTAQWARNNPERRREIVRASVERNRQAHVAAQRKWRLARLASDPAGERLRHAVRAHNRRVLEKNIGKMDAREANLVLAVARGVCTYCGARGRFLTIDHFRPITSPGATHAWSNLIACCKSCNSSKNASDGADWILKRFGAPGLARTLFAMKANRKAVRRLLPPAYWRQVELEQDRMLSALETAR